MSMARGAAAYGGAVRCGTAARRGRRAADIRHLACCSSLCATIHPLPAASIRLQCFKHSIALTSNKGFPRNAYKINVFFFALCSL